MTHSVSRSGLGLLMAGAAACALPAAAAAAPSLSVLARGFDNPRHVALAPDGTLYLAAAGKAGGQCVGPRREPTCIGYSGKIWALTPGSGAKRVVQAGLLSLGGQDGTFTVGPDGVAVGPDGALFTVIASGTPREVGGAPRRAQAQAGELWRVLPKPLTDVASIDSFEWRHNSDGVRGDINSDPYDVLALRDGRQIVADAGANAILEVSAER